MSKVKYLITYLFITCAIFFAMLYQNSNTKLIVSMSKDLAPKIYYSKSRDFSEKRTILPYEINNNIYTFILPKKQINYIRFDPTTKKDIPIKINSITIEKNSYFKSIKFTISFDKIIKNSQIKEFVKNSIVSFKTTGNDPWLLIKFAPKKEYSKINYHLIKLALSLFIALILTYLIYIYQNYEYNQNLRAKLILYSLFFAFIAFKAYYYKENVHFGYPPDEAYHYKYVEYVDKNRSFIPKFENMPHYLAHPPIYYEIVSLVLDDKISKRDNITKVREFSYFIFLFALFLIFYIGFLAKFTILGDFVYLSFVGSIPMFAYIGGSISNDTLAIFAGALSILALKRLLDKDFTTTTYIVLALAIFISYFAKLTAAILLFFALIYYVLYLFIKKEPIKIRFLDIAILILALAPIFYYQLSIFQNYHAITPTYNVTHPKEFLESRFFTPPEYRLHLSPIEWAQRMLHYIQGGWFGIHSHHSFGHEKWSGVFGLIILHIIAIVAIFFRCKENSSNICIVGKITLLALFSTLLVQYLFSYKAHINNGYMGGLQPRYVLPFMLSFAIMASVFVQKFQKSFWFSIFIIAISIHALYSDFFYFLLYYN